MLSCSGAVTLTDERSASVVSVLLRNNSTDVSVSTDDSAVGSSMLAGPHATDIRPRAAAH